jgi:hypothetical protein
VIDVPMPALPTTIRSSFVAAQEFRHRFSVRDRTRPAGLHPSPMVGQRRLDFGLFQDLGGRMTLYSPEPLQLRERDDGGRFTTEVNDPVRFPRAVIICRLCAHRYTTIPMLGWPVTPR